MDLFQLKHIFKEFNEGGYNITIVIETIPIITGDTKKTS